MIRERIATPFYLVRLQGPPPYFLTLGIESSIEIFLVGLEMHLEKQIFYRQSKMAAYPSGKGTDCNPVLPGSTPGAASIFFNLRNRLLDNKIRRSESINVYHTHHVNKKGVI